jgi:hypothetical protein
MTKILIQLDTDPRPSVFDAVVAIDAGVDRLLQYGGISPSAVQQLVHGAMFTRGGDDLKNTAIFIGGRDVAAAEAVLRAVCETFFGPVRVSVLFDANGANTTAAAAVLAAARHVDLSAATALVLGGTGPVGSRAVRLLAREGAIVRVGSRDIERAKTACRAVRSVVSAANVTPIATGNEEETVAAAQGANVIIAAGAAGMQVLSADARLRLDGLAIAIDLNAVPPAGIEGIKATDKAAPRDGAVCYGAIGVGGTKMKIHKQAIHRLFEANDQVLDADEIFAIGKQIDNSRSP